MTAKEALEFYADEGNWIIPTPYEHDCSNIEKDKGNKARQTLSQITPQTDQDALMQLISSLGLSETKKVHYPSGEEYGIDANRDDGFIKICIGSGEEYNESFAAFLFDESGKLIIYSIGE